MISIFNKYCKLCSYATDICNGFYSVHFNKLPVKFEIGSVKTTSIKNGVLDFGERPLIIDAEFGRNVIVTGGTTNTTEVIVDGYDYLGQKMTEKFTLNNTTPVVGKKAFKYISSVFNAKGTADTIKVEGGLILGLPYRTAKIVSETRDGVEASTSKLVVPVNTKQTAVTGDPRGTVNLTTYASPADIELVLLSSPTIFTIDDVQVGGLHGIPQYFE